MKGEVFKIEYLRDLWWPEKTATKLNGGQITIIGGSELFHGAPVLALRAASRIVDMVFFATPKSNHKVIDRVKSSLSAFILMPFEDLDNYLRKCDSILIGPGLMRYRSEKGDHQGAVCDEVGRETKILTEDLLRKFPDKKWVIDGGSLQVMDPKLIPFGAVLTPNIKEFGMLFGEFVNMSDLEKTTDQVMRRAKQYNCVICLKGATTIVTDGTKTYWVDGGSVGLIKGGTGDIVAGLTTAFLAKSEPLLSAAAANFVVKKASEELEAERGLMYNADDVAEQVPKTWGRLISS